MASAKTSRPERAAASLTGHRAIRQRATESLMSGIFKVCGCLSVVAVVLITVYMVGRPASARSGWVSSSLAPSGFPPPPPKIPLLASSP